eukprot:765386-Hanusia_phi.AAC.1
MSIFHSFVMSRVERHHATLLSMVSAISFAEACIQPPFIPLHASILPSLPSLRHGKYFFLFCFGLLQFSTPEGAGPAGPGAGRPAGPSGRASESQQRPAANFERLSVTQDSLAQLHGRHNGVRAGTGAISDPARTSLGVRNFDNMVLIGCQRCCDDGGGFDFKSDRAQ